MINEANISEMWSAANALLEERLIRMCIGMIKPRLDVLSTDSGFLKDTSPLGFIHLYLNLDTSSSANLPIE